MQRNRFQSAKSKNSERSISGESVRHIFLACYIESIFTILLILRSYTCLRVLTLLETEKTHEKTGHVRSGLCRAAGRCIPGRCARQALSRLASRLLLRQLPYALLHSFV